MITESTDYSGRLVDLEYLQTVLTPVGITPVSKSLAMKQPKMVTGMQKLLQRYTTILLTTLGDVYIDPTQGTNFISRILKGGGRSQGHIVQTWAFANVDVIEQLRREDNDTDTFGPLEDDERIASANLIGYEVDASTSSLNLVIYIENVVGSSFTYIVPVPVPRS